MASTFIGVVPVIPSKSGVAVCCYKLTISGGEIGATDLPLIVANASNPQLRTGTTLEKDRFVQVLGWHNYQTAAGELTFTISGAGATHKVNVEAGNLSFTKLLSKEPFVVGISQPGVAGFNVTVRSSVAMEAIVYVALSSGIVF